MLNQQQYQKLQNMGLSARKMQQVLNAAGGVEQRKSFGGFIGNTVKSGGKLIGDTVMGAVNILNPNIEKNTLANLADLAWDSGAQIFANGSNKLRPLLGKKEYSKQELDNLVDNMPTLIGGTNRGRELWNFYKDRYGGVENIKETLYNDPVGVLADLSTIVSGAGALAKGVGNVSRSTQLSNIGSKASNIGRAVDPLAIAGSGVKTAVKPLTNVISNADLPAFLNKKANQVTTRGIGNPAKQSELRRPLSEYIREYDLWSRDPDAAAAAQRMVGERYGNLVRGSDKLTQAKLIIDAIDQEMANIQNGPMGDFDAERLNTLSQQKINILGSLGSGDLSGSQLLDYRQMLDRDIKPGTYDPAKSASGKQSALKTTRDIFKNNIDALSPEIANSGIQYGDLGKVKKILTGSQSRAVNRQAINFTKLGTAGLGGVIAGVPGAIAGFAAEQLVNSPQGIKAASQSLQGLSAALETARQAAQTPASLSRLEKMRSAYGVVAPQVYNVARTGRMLNQPMQNNNSQQSYSPQMPRQAQSAPRNPAALLKPASNNTTTARARLTKASLKSTPVKIDFSLPKLAFEAPKRQKISVPKY